MKALKNIIFISVLAIVFTTCKKEEKPEPRTITVNGKVVDSDGNPISNVKIVMGERECNPDVLPNYNSSLTIVTYTDSNGYFSANYLDKYPALPMKNGSLENGGHNCFHDDLIWFYKDGYYTNADGYFSVYGFTERFKDSALVLQMASFVKLILNPVSAADGIAIYEHFYNHPFYHSNLYARADEQPNCRKDNPRYKEFYFVVKPDTDIKFKWETFSGGSCYPSSFKEKTMRSNPDNKDTLIFQIDY